MYSFKCCVLQALLLCANWIDQTGYVFGTSGYLAKTTNQGLSWSAIPCPPTYHFMCAHVFDENQMIAGTSWGKILKSADGGKTWVEKHSETGEVFADICFLDNLNGFAVSGHSKIYRTTDGGETWTVSQVGLFKEYTHIHFINSTTGWISGSDGYMLRTTDGGTTWNQVYIGTHQSQNVVYFFDEQNGFLAGNGGMLLHTSNGGYTSVPGTYQSAGNKPELTLFPNPFSRGLPSFPQFPVW